MNMTKYHYSAYWHTWSRVLSEDTSRGYSIYVEVDLTPINDTKEGWQRVSFSNIRKHVTPRQPRDIDTNVIPSQIVKRMARHLPANIIKQLLFEDILPCIDWVLYLEHSNGGCPLYKCTNLEKELVVEDDRI